MGAMSVGGFKGKNSNGDYGALDASGNLRPYTGGKSYKSQGNRGRKLKGEEQRSVVTNIKLSRGFHERKNVSNDKARSQSGLSNSRSNQAVSNATTIDHGTRNAGEKINSRQKNLA